MIELEEVSVRRAGEPLRHRRVLRVDGPVGGARDAVEARPDAGLGRVEQRLRLGRRRRRRLGWRRRGGRGRSRSRGRGRGRRRLRLRGRRGRFRRSGGLRLRRGLVQMLRRGLGLWLARGRSGRRGLGRLILILSLSDQKRARGCRGRRSSGGAEKGGANQTTRRAPHALPDEARGHEPLAIRPVKLKPQTPGILLGHRSRI